MTKFYRPRPIAIEAFAWRPGKSLPTWLTEHAHVVGQDLVVRCRDGDARVHDGDYVVRGSEAPSVIPGRQFEQAFYEIEDPPPPAQDVAGRA